MYLTCLPTEPSCTEYQTAYQFPFPSQQLLTPSEKATMAIRLIDTTTLRFRETLGHDTPEYAILSHTWGSDEITYQDMLRIVKAPNDAAHAKREFSGYNKIKITCEKAASAGIKFAWVDTCCIDKTSSSELSEAINTMYRWYQGAKVCYAFLADLDANSAPLETSLPRCRWFTRGWCLQELIAPRAVEFFDANWKPIGSRADLALLIHRITQIDREVLADNTRLQSIPVARRMSWAARRQTTREEDRAYSLLGIFNVNMPMLYGEGSKAFVRLQEEIIKTSNDLSLFAFYQPRSATSQSQPGSLNLFAVTPEDFIDCGSLVSTGTGVHWNDAFALTNKGLYFRRAKLQVDVEHGWYSMPLNCKHQPHESQTARMFLQKVGPGLFARCSEGSSSPDGADGRGGDDQGATETVEAYVISVPVQAQLDRSGENAVYITPGEYGLSKALQVIQRAPSSDSWDMARMRFITTGEPCIQGFWKIFPSLLRPTAAGREARPKARQSHCYLVCGVEDSPRPSSSGPRAWVRLCSACEWTGLERAFGIITQGNDQNSPLCTNKTSDQITLDETSGAHSTITATVRRVARGGIPCFELGLELEFDDGQATKALERESSSHGPAVHVKDRNGGPNLEKGAIKGSRLWLWYRWRGVKQDGAF